MHRRIELFRPAAAAMYLIVQQSPDPVPYRGAYFRLASRDGLPSRGSVVLAPPEPTGDDLEALARLLGLAVALGEPGAGGTAIRQHWLTPELRLQGKLDSEISPRHAAEAERISARIETEWARFLGNCFARLRGESRGDSHLEYPGGVWNADQPTVRITAWPPLGGVVLPELGVAPTGSGSDDASADA